MAGSQAEREQTIGALKAAFVQGRLTMDEFDARIGQTFTSRTYAELAAVTADIPDGLPAVRPPRREAARPRMNHAVRWGASGFVAPVLVAASLVLGTLSGGYMAVGLVIAVGYFLVWLSIGTNMLWEWHCMSLPTAKMCVRCGHTPAAHRTPESCTVRLGSLTLWQRCPCGGFLPPGVSPEADLRFPVDSLAF